MRNRKLVDRYRAWCRLPDATGTDTPEGRAWSAAHNLIEKDGDTARGVLLAVAKGLDSTEIDALVSLGTDCLQDLLRADRERHFPVFEDEAKTNGTVAIAMSGVWLREQPWKA